MTSPRTLARRFSLTALAIGATLAAFAPSASYAHSTVTVAPTQVLQRIDGFGASDAWYGAWIHLYTDQTTQLQILDDLFSPTTGAGLSLLRDRVPPTIEPSPGVFDWTTDNDIVWLNYEAQARGVSQVWSSVWSPPAWMKLSGDVNNGGAVDPNQYANYANYLAEYVTQYKQQFGITISGISIANEPNFSGDYESTTWNGQQFHDFILNNLGPTFAQDGVTANIIMPEEFFWDDSLAAQTLQDPATAASVGIVATHNYGGTIAPFTDAEALGKPVWETEVSNVGTDDESIANCLSWAVTVHNSITVGKANAWHWWWAFDDYADTTGQSLIYGNPWNDTMRVSKRLWFMGNFARFVRPGDHLCAVSSNAPENGVYVSAYVHGNPSNQLEVVAINTNANSTNLTLNVPNFNAGNAEMFRTSSTENLADIGSTSASSGTLTQFLPAQSVTTFVIKQPVAPGIGLVHGVSAAYINAGLLQVVLSNNGGSTVNNLTLNPARCKWGGQLPASISPSTPLSLPPGFSATYVLQFNGGPYTGMATITGSDSAGAFTSLIAVQKPVLTAPPQ